MNQRPFSLPWTLASVGVITGLEIATGLVAAPVLAASHFASPPVLLMLQALMHLASFWLGGFVTSLASHGERSVEPAVGAFIAVCLVFTMSFFMPYAFLQWDWLKILVGGALGSGLAFSGVCAAERLMAPFRSDARSSSSFTTSIASARGLFADAGSFDRVDVPRSLDARSRR